MAGLDLFSAILVLVFASLLAYKASFLHNKTIGYFSLLQILYLVIVPGIMFTLLYSYIQAIIARPRVENPLFSDKFLISGILLSMFYTYGGLAVHAVGKMLASLLRKEHGETAQFNRYLHLTFSHNLTLSGAFFVMVGITLLELNHVPGIYYRNWLAPVWRGFFLGIMFIAAMFFYTRSKDRYVGRWADLKASFFVFWVGFILILYAIRRFNPFFREYELLFPALVSFLVIAFLNLILVYRQFKNGRFRWEVQLKHLLGANEDDTSFPEDE